MKKPCSVTLVLKVSYCCAALLALGCSSSMAGYAVIDDDLLPTAMSQRQAPKHQEHYEIPFLRERSALTDANRASLDMLLPRLYQAPVRIVGRPDAGVIGPDKAAALARSRAYNLRDYLVRKGIPAAAITIEVNATPNPQPYGNGYPSDLYIGSASYLPVVGSPPSARQDIEEYLPNNSSPHPNATNEQLMRFINEALKNGQMEPSVALTLLRSMVPTSPIAQAQPQVSSQYREISYQPAPAQTVAYPTTNKWPIRKSLSLRQNVEAWARTEGYELVWELPPSFDPQIRTDTSVAAPSFAAAVEVLLKGLHAKGYRFVAVNLYADHIVQFTEAKSL